MGHLLQLILLSLCFFVAHSALTAKQSDFVLGGYFAKQRPWTEVLAGQTGAAQNTQPRRIHHTACGSKYFVAWTSRRGEAKDVQFPEFYNENTVGHITTFSVSAQGVPSLVKDVAFPACNEMGNIYCAPDGTIVAAMCRSSANSVGGAAVDFVSKNKDTSGKAPFGWDQTSQSDPAKPNYRVVDNMFLLEFANGQISSTPSHSVRINHAIGGWAYGHYEVRLNAAKTVYFISMKTTIFGGGTWHEGSVSFEMNRGSWTLNSPSAWACGGGHVESNRAVYNPHLNKFALFCKTDLSNNNGGPNAAYYTTDIRKPAVQVQSYPKRTTPNPFWHGNGGPFNLLPTPTGFIGAGLGPGGDGKPVTVGIINLPGDHTTFKPATSAFKWIDLPDTAVDNTAMPATGFPKIGYPNFSPIGKSGKYLIGWAILGETTKTHRVAEIDGNGCIHGNTIPVHGWGQDDVWSYSPVSGCVLMPYVWRDNADAGSKYGDCKQCASVESTMFSKKLRIISVCANSVAGATSCKFTPSSRNAAVAGEASSFDSVDSSAAAVSPAVWVGVGIGVAALVAVVVVIVVVVKTRKSQIESV